MPQECVTCGAGLPTPLHNTPLPVNCRECSRDYANVVAMRHGFKAAIIDLDGTLCNCDHRRRFVEVPEGQLKDWDSFLAPEAVMRDKLVESVADLVRHMSDKYVIIYASGRHSGLRSTSIAWLRKHGMWFYPHALYMRAEGDRRPDTEVKRDLLSEIRKRFNPVIAIDDRTSVVRMWREEGLTCLQVAEGDF